MDTLVPTAMPAWRRWATPVTPASLLARYGFSLACVVSALVARMALDPFLDDRQPFTTLYAAVTLAAWFGGIGPALMASIIGWLAADWFFTHPRHAFGVESFSDFIGVATYLFVGIAVAMFSGAMHRARARAERSATQLAQYGEHLEDLVRERTAELEQSYNLLRTSERMAMLGTLSAGLGHDLGNLLMPLQARLDALDQRNHVPEAREDINAIRSCAAYLQGLANGLRMLAIDPDSTLVNESSTDIIAWWADAQSLLKNTVPKNVTIEARWPENVPSLRIAPTSLTQALFNLVQNAGEALREQADARIVIWARQTPDGRRVTVGVTDNGPGMSEEVRDKCLQPFFSTKRRPNSMGLGLALVHHIAKSCGGALEIDTQINRGTTFMLTLEICEPARTDTGASAAARGHALVSIEDERLGAFIAVTLESLAYDVSRGDRPRDANTTLWVADGRFARQEDTERFVEGHPQRRVILFGESHSLRPGAPRIIALQAQSKPGDIRRALAQAAMVDPVPVRDAKADRETER